VRRPRLIDRTERRRPLRWAAQLSEISHASMKKEFPRLCLLKDAAVRELVGMVLGCARQDGDVCDSMHGRRGFAVGMRLGGNGESPHLLTHIGPADLV
jgi:hypothetical protein